MLTNVIVATTVNGKKHVDYVKPTGLLVALDPATGPSLADGVYDLKLNPIKEQAAVASKSKAVSFTDALKVVKAGDEPADEPTSAERGSRFVETGEGLEIIRASDSTRESSDAKKVAPKMVPIEDLLLDILEEEEAKEAAAKAGN